MADRLSVLHIITGLENGGAEAMLDRLVTNCPACRHTVISMLDEGVYGPRLAASGVPVHTLNMRRGGMTLAGLRRLGALLRTVKPDVVQTWMYHADLIGGTASRLGGIGPVVWGLHNSDLSPGKTKRTTRAVVRACAALSRFVPARIISCSRQAAVAHERMGYASSRFVVIPNGYDLSVFRIDPEAGQRVRAELGVRPGEMLLGMVARFDPQKDHANLFRALALSIRDHPDLRCLLVGEGMHADNAVLTAMVAANGLGNRVVLVGPRSDIPAVMNALDVHVLSSSGEAFPNVVAEAMASGTPCVVTDVGDAAYIVGDTGWVVAPSDASALSAAISKAVVAARTGETAPLGRLARQRVVEHFSIEQVVQQYHRVWVEAARSRGEGGANLSCPN
jgi:glycosyltransferase involved in cell wall biosynthesis